MTPTPGVLRQFAATAIHDAEDYRRWSHEASDPNLKRYFLRCADTREDDAGWYLARAETNKITTTFQEAAE